MARFRILPRPRPINPTVQKLPQELVDIIFSLLSTPDQICFSLSCKHLFACLHSYLDIQGIRLPRLIPSGRREMFSKFPEKQPRVQLLLQLENKRWKYCPECWYLHRCSTWRALRATWRLRRNPYCSSLELPRDQSCPLLYAGEADICPCHTISFRDKLWIIEACRDARQPEKHIIRYYYGANALDEPIYGKIHKTLWHRCTFTDHTRATVQIETTLRMDEKTNSLRVRSWYRFRPRPGNALQGVPMGMGASLMCPKEHIRNWLEKFFDEAGSGYLGWDRNHPSCPSIRYDRSGWGRPVKGDGPRSFELIITRDLGNGKWPNKNWDDHRRR